MSNSPSLTPLVDSLPAATPFVGPETLERRRGEAFTARLGANESVFGPSPQAIAAMAAAAGEAWMYGDPELFDLKAALALKHGVKPEQIVVGEGIDGLLGLTVRLLTEPGAAVVTSLGAYPTFNYHVAGFGGRLITEPYRDDRQDLEALTTTAAREGARLVYLSNPDNPMGGCWEAAAIKAMIDRLPENALLCLDEAYIETAPEGSAPQIDPEQPNVLRFRTFSKAMGLAGLRVGYAIGPAALIAAFNRIRNHFGVGRVAQAGALAALGDERHLQQVVLQVAESRERIAAIARAHGLKPLSSATNFVAIDCGRDGIFATRVLEQLAARGVFVRMPGVPPLNRCIRISCGREEDLAALEQVLPEALAAAQI